jgi:uncharacterized membrane protein HdeD (DUF308 family)
VVQWELLDRGRNPRRTTNRRETIMIVLGIILLIIGFIAKIAILWTLGIILVVIGLILALVGAGGREIAGRRHWY